MNTAKLRDVWLVALIASVLIGFGFSQATADRGSVQNPSYTFAVSTGPELQLVNVRGDISTHGASQVTSRGKTLVCENLISIATARLGHNCRPTISGVASKSHQ